MGQFLAAVATLLAPILPMIAKTLALRAQLSLDSVRVRHVSLKKYVDTRDSASFFNTTGITPYVARLNPTYTRQESADYEIAVARFVNPPKKNWGIEAEAVSAQLSFYDVDVNPKFDGQLIAGRWLDEPEGWDLPPGGSWKSLESVTFGVGQWRDVALAIKRKDARIMYAYNLESHKSDEWRLEKYALGSRPHKICIKLVGRNLREMKNMWFTLSINRDGGLEVRAEPANRRQGTQETS